MSTGIGGIGSFNPKSLSSSLDGIESGGEDLNPDISGSGIVGPFNATIRNLIDKMNLNKRMAEDERVLSQFVDPSVALDPSGGLTSQGSLSIDRLYFQYQSLLNTPTIREKLGVTDDQLEKVIVLKKNQEKQSQQLESKIAQQELQLDSGLAAQDSNFTAEGLRRSVEAYKTQLSQTRLGYFFGLNELLKPEQLSQLTRLAKESMRQEDLSRLADATSRLKNAKDTQGDAS